MHRCVLVYLCRSVSVWSGGCGGGDSDRVQAQVQGRSFLWFRWTPFRCLNLFHKLCVKLFYWLTALWI